MMDYKIAEDIKIVCELLNISFSSLTKDLQLDEKTLYRTINGITELSDKNKKLFYNYVFNNKIHLNKIKEMFYKEEVQKDKILLFHGAKAKISGEIKTCLSRKTNDFGQGFYCGESYEQSASFVEAFTDSSVYAVLFNESDLNRIEFSVNRDWMLTIAYFRGRLDEYKNSKIIKKLINDIYNADYIVAPIADNRMFKIIDSFIDGEITDEQCKHCLAATNLGRQYVIKTEKAVNNVQILERLFLCEEERNYYRNIKTNDHKLSDDKVKLARIQYRGKGRYIEEILK